MIRTLAAGLLAAFTLVAFGARADDAAMDKKEGKMDTKATGKKMHKMKKHGKMTKGADGAAAKTTTEPKADPAPAAKP